MTTCANHPSVETGVSCGKCGKPLCPSCMIFTPVGIRCKQCAQLKRPPQYQLGTATYTRLLLVCFGLILGGGLVLGKLGGLGLGLIVILYGWAIGEAINRATKYKRGVVIEVAAGATVVLTVVAAQLVAATPPDGLLSMAQYGHVLTSLLAGNLYAWIGPVLGIIVAVGRVR